MLAKYGLQIIAVLFVIGGYYYWKHEVVQEERDHWKQRDAITSAKAQTYLDLKNHEIEVVKAKNEETYNETVKSFEHYITDLNARRVQQRTEKPNTRRNSVQTRCSDTSGIGGTGSPVLLQSEVALGAKACELLIERFLIPNSVIK